MQYRMRARMAPFLMFTGGVLTMWGTCLPLVGVSNGGLLAPRTLTPSAHADAMISGAAPKLFLCATIIAVAAALLAGTRIGVLGLIWRKAAAVAVVAVPGRLAAELWLHLIGPDAFARVPVSPIYPRHAAAVAHPASGSLGAGTGLVLISVGCLATVAGCIWPAARYQRFTGEFRSPRARYGTAS